jgi:hypothetical protein
MIYCTGRQERVLYQRYLSGLLRRRSICAFAGLSERVIRLPMRHMLRSPCSIPAICPNQLPAHVPHFESMLESCGFQCLPKVTDGSACLLPIRAGRAEISRAAGATRLLSHLVVAYPTTVTTSLPTRICASEDAVCSSDLLEDDPQQSLISEVAEACSAVPQHRAGILQFSRMMLAAWRQLGVFRAMVGG